jgi:predicted metal-dependent phosphoesterase TrpH
VSATPPGPPGPRARRRRHDPTPLPDPVVPPAPSPADLHTHTRRSDGVLAPAELVAAAVACGVTILAITDHDTLAGYREVVAAGLVPPGLTLVPGIEINALVTRDLGLWEGELHILGFGMDPGDDAFEAALAGQRAQRRIRFDRTVDRLRDLGFSIDAEVAGLARDGDDALGRPTLARALIAAGHAASVEDAFRRLLGHGCPAYVPRLGLGPVEAIAAIRDAGGLAALAHFREAPERPEVVRELVEAGLGGLEVYYRAFDRPAVQAVGQVAESLGLVPTGGTDYHGDTGTYADAHAQVWVPPEAAERLLERLPAGPAGPGRTMARS